MYAGNTGDSEQSAVGNDNTSTVADTLPKSTSMTQRAPKSDSEATLSASELEEASPQQPGPSQGLFSYWS